MHRLLIAGVGLAAIALLALGCASNGDDGEPVQALSKSQYIQHADEACARAAERREAAISKWKQEHPGKLDAEGLNDVFKEVLVPSVDEQIEALQTLAAPVDDRAEVARMLHSLATANRNFEMGGTRGTQQPGLAEYEAEAREYGLKICPRLY